MSRLLLINGPNLNLLGTREPGVYGHTDLDAIVNAATQQAMALGHELAHFQSNHEGGLVERIHQAAKEHVDFIVINPAAYTHTSVALRDALLATGIPFIEIHLSNVHAREPFRHHSYLSDIAQGVISGFGALGYRLAIEAATDALGQPRKR
ncbi:type II 3-dehydroquinate dehydratase [Acidihalobacter yilgarnensis]|uniref:3-dehydroquinate dehydratase n=1 Tax=Acidihalobacter yilgarnensis TaxID=2819280 RepID=A0A1D8IKP0_9GAMM|nr:type II 3-dehydroquinate dehydratase [Acidihalobacter yilgarnensis]AOU97030.1 type II 3-dehydroquinate dehydratase [Acidihalobacter yilgarnensis]